MNMNEEVHSRVPMSGKKEHRMTRQSNADVLFFCLFEAIPLYHIEQLVASVFCIRYTKNFTDLC